MLTTLILSARTAATMLLPVAPDASSEILRQLNLEAETLSGAQQLSLPDGYICGEPKPVFPRLELPVTDPS